MHPITGETKLHTGVDYSAPTGTPILATADGRVYFAGASAGYGHLILIDHTVNGQRVSSGYAHMFGERIYVRAGDPVTAGQHIADIGMYGYTTGPGGGAICKPECTQRGNVLARQHAIGRVQRRILHRPGSVTLRHSEDPAA